MMIKFSQMLKEAKQVGLLYHYTTIEGMLGIVKRNRLGDKDHDSFSFNNPISFAYNKNFHKLQKTKTIPTDAVFIIDGDKLSEHYKISPYGWKLPYFWGSEKTYDEYQANKSKHKDWLEYQYEARSNRPIDNIKKYTQKIIVDELHLDYHVSNLYEEIGEIMGIDGELITDRDVIDFIESRGFNVEIGRLK